MKDGEIFDKINRLDNRIVKNTKTKDKDIKKLKDEIFELEKQLKNAKKKDKKMENTKIALIGISGALVTASLISLIATFSFFVLNLGVFIPAICLGVLLSAGAVIISEKNKPLKNEIEELESNLKTANDKLFKKEHIVETLDERREKLYKKLDRQLNKSTKNVSKNLPVRDKTIINKKTRAKKVNNSNQDLTK